MKSGMLLSSPGHFCLSLEWVLFKGGTVCVSKAESWKPLSWCPGLPSGEPRQGGDSSSSLAPPPPFLVLPDLAWPSISPGRLSGQPPALGASLAVFLFSLPANPLHSQSANFPLALKPPTPLHSCPL